jgi:hypothetical protein
LLDEMFSPTIAARLQALGRDVVAVAADPELRSLTDPELMAWASEHGRRIVTENVRDFRPLVVDAPTGAGVLFTSSRAFPRNRRAAGKLVAALDAWIVASEKVDRSVEAWLEPPSAGQ